MLAHAGVQNWDYPNGSNGVNLSPGAYTDYIPGWTQDGIAGVSTNGDIASGYFLQNPPDGDLCVYINTGSISTQSYLDLAAGTTTLSLYFGNRLDGYYQGIAEVQLWAGGSPYGGSVTGGTLLKDVLLDTSTVPLGYYSPFSVTYSNSSPAGVGQPLSVVIAAYSGRVVFDELTLTTPNAVPEPKPGLLGLAVFGLAVRNRRGRLKRRS